MTYRDELIALITAFRQRNGHEPDEVELKNLRAAAANTVFNRPVDLVITHEFFNPRLYTVYAVTHAAYQWLGREWVSYEPSDWKKAARDARAIRLKTIYDPVSTVMTAETESKLWDAVADRRHGDRRKLVGSGHYGRPDVCRRKGERRFIKHSPAW